MNQNLTLETREWICPECNKKLDRDINAEKNILIEGNKNISPGTGDYRRGAKISPSLLGTSYKTSKIQV